jgi:hypothetical protein
VPSQRHGKRVSILILKSEALTLKKYDYYEKIGHLTVISAEAGIERNNR